MASAFLTLLIAVTLGLLVAQVVRVEVVALGLLGVLGLSGILTVPEVFSGFSNSATLTVAAMLILSAGLERTGVVEYIGNFLMARTGDRIGGLLLTMALPTAILSAFMNNTAIVALMIPVALTLSRRKKIYPSKLLMPISFLSILAGTCTLIGTSTNILVDSLYRQAGGSGFSMFEFSRLGVIYLVVGGTYSILVAPRLIPNRTALATLMKSDAKENFVTEVRVPPTSRLVGRSLRDAFGNSEGLRILELIRDELVVMGPSLEMKISADDLLLIEGSAKEIHDIIEQGKVQRGTAVSDSERVTIKRLDLRMVEAVVASNSRFLMRRVRDIGLSRKQGIQVLAVRRLGRHHQYNLRDFRLQAGDVLLLQGTDEALHQLQDDGEVLLIEGVEKTLTFTRKAPLALLIMLAVILLATLTSAPIAVLALAGVVAMLVTGCLNVPRATRALDSSVLLLLAGMIPLGVAMEKTGMASSIANGVVVLANPFGPVVLIGAFYLLTSLLTAILSNNASAVLLVPIGLGVAATTGIDPKPLLVAVTFGASASFATPIGYQTNAMVMGPGGYTVRDYIRAGLPLNLLLCVIATIFIPLFWPP